MIKDKLTILLLILTTNFLTAQGIDPILKKINVAENSSKILLNSINSFASAGSDYSAEAHISKVKSKASELYNLIIKIHKETEDYNAKRKTESNYSSVSNDIVSMKNKLVYAYTATDDIFKQATKISNNVRSSSVKMYYSNMVNAHKRLSENLKESKQNLYNVVKKNSLSDVKKSNEITSEEINAEAKRQKAFEEFKKKNQY